MVTKISKTLRLFEEKKEECGIIAIYSKKGKNVAPMIYRALVSLQHRGQDAAGFAVYNGKAIEARRGIGLVDGIFEPKDLELEGSVGIGHTRYPTCGECQMCDVQPFVYKNIAISHNGHVANYKELKKELENEYQFESTVDSEVFSFLIDKSSHKGIELAIKTIFTKVEGAYSDVSIIDGKIVVFRDPFAIRPLVWGENSEYIAFASETVALDTIGIEYKGEVRGGELVIVDRSKVTRKQLSKEVPKHCMFEYVYFSRPDSRVGDESIHKVRERLGEILADESPVDADVVVAVPDTARTAATGFSIKLGIPSKEGLIKNRYIGRTFIMPSQDKRVEAVKLKLNPVRDIIEGQRVVLIDDSIVRGTTLKEIVSLVRSVGAKEVHVRVSCPPIIAPCFYGVDMSTYEELIANKKSIDQIKKFLGADSLAYISLEGLKKAINQPICTGCLTNQYQTAYVTEHAEKVRSQK